MKVAIIGSGFSGLVSAYVLAKGVEVVLNEKQDYLGGHARTITYDGVDLDLGFMVFSVFYDVQPSVIDMVNVNVGFVDLWTDREIAGSTILTGDGSEDTYNGCIMAVHAPNAVTKLGEQATSDERRILGAFQYVYSDTYLRRDNDFMPQNPATWSSWNYLGSTDKKVCLTYWLNVIQNLGQTSPPFFVTLNPNHTPNYTLLKWSTSHPVPSVAASKASQELHRIQGKRGIWFVEHTRVMAFMRMD